MLWMPGDAWAWLERGIHHLLRESLGVQVKFRDAYL